MEKELHLIERVRENPKRATATFDFVSCLEQVINHCLGSVLADCYIFCPAITRFFSCLLLLLCKKDGDEHNASTVFLGHGPHGNEVFLTNPSTLTL